MSFLKKIANIFELPPMILTSERENEIAEDIVKKISNFGFEYQMTFMVSGLVPASTILSLTVLLPMSPILEAFGIPGYELVAFFRNKKNMERILNRLDELSRERGI